MSAKQKIVKVLVVEDHPMMRDGLRSSLEQESGIRIVGETGTGEEAVRLALRKLPDIVIMDIGLPDMSGIDATREIKAKAPGIRVIALTVRADSDTIREMVQAGALGFLSKESFCQDLIAAIGCVMKGERYLSKDVAEVVIDDFAKPTGGAAAAPPVPALTERQREVLKLIRESKSTKDIADRLGVSAKTVAYHRQGIMEKLGIENLRDLLMYAMTHES